MVTLEHDFFEGFLRLKADRYNHEFAICGNFRKPYLCKVRGSGLHLRYSLGLERSIKQKDKNKARDYNTRGTSKSAEPFILSRVAWGVPIGPLNAPRLNLNLDP